MNKQEIIEADQEYFMNVFSGRFPLVADHGQGIKVFDKDGREYLDFMAGIGVNILGYNHPELTAALESQVNKITHCSNLYYIEPQAKLEKLLVQNSVADRVFFTNSGAEANEGALKLARKYNPDKFEIISAERSFHGRTLGTLAATGQKKYREPFQPLPGGFKYIPYNDLEAAREAVGPETAAIILEPIQGEGGLYPAKASYLKGVRRLCDEENILLIFDEIQCGMGRTGHLFAFEKYGVEPDIFTLAKGLGGGIPVGAFLATEEVA
ncbi:MAG: aspartate aminotransferase family protein, partial [Bacillota bacterium]